MGKAHDTGARAEEARGPFVLWPRWLDEALGLEAPWPGPVELPGVEVRETEALRADGLADWMERT
jgi:hypothetical protein